MRKLILAMAAVLLFAGACGDDDSTSLSDLADSGDDGGSGGDTDSGDDVSFGEGSDSDFCQFNDDINGGMEDVDVFGDPDSIESAFEDVADTIDRAVAVAPGEIRDDVEYLAESVDGFIEFLAEYDYDLLSVPEDAQDDPRLAVGDDPAYDAALERVNAFCGVEEDEPSTDGFGDDDSDVPDQIPDIDDGDMRDLVIQSLQTTFGWDDDLASCVVDELNLTDPESIDPSIFGDPNGEVCGHSFAELFVTG